tara:strand:+ start:8185 stop:8835 length:651 start_codon:yes stop_codon:yes gene_type:complete
MSNVLVLAAHPDDETLGCGATIAKLSHEGHNVSLLTFTDGTGARGEGLGDRNKKLDAVSDILGISDYKAGNFPDNEMDSVSLLSVCKFIEQSVTKTPDIILTHHPGCLNIDHVTVYRATMTVFRPQNGTGIDIMSYFVPSSTDYNPVSNFAANTYIDVGNYVDKKIKVLEECYAEEMREEPHTRSIIGVINRMITDGSEVGLQYAEKFQTFRRIIK